MRTKIPYRYTTLPKLWPGKQRPVGWTRTRGPFKVTTWNAIENLLSFELQKLGAKDVVLAIDLPNPAHWNMQGAPRADARAASPAVVVSFTNRDGVRLTFPCDTYSDWQTNVYAIARSLENLRAVDRYGVTQGDAQYVGFRALPPGGGTGPRAMSAEEAAEIIAQYSELPAHVILAEPSVARVAIRAAKRNTHPDVGGDADEFKRVGEASDVLEKLHGEPE